jgi:LysR family transcriptional activator of nhaA
METLLPDLAAYQLDVVLTDTPVSATLSAKYRTFNHLLGECGVSILGPAKPAPGSPLARPGPAYADGFPASLDGVAMFLPADTTSMRRSLDQYFVARKIRPRILGEFEDPALMATFGRTARALYPAPSVVEAQVCRQFDSVPVGRIPDVKERFYAVSVERRLKNPAVVAVCETARRELFTAPAAT